MNYGYVFTPVCHSVHRGGVSQHAMGQTPPSPGRQTPQEETRKTPPGRQTPPQEDPPEAVHARRYGQQASGTHPTGMHTCFYIKWMWSNTNKRIYIHFRINITHKSRTETSDCTKIKSVSQMAAFYCSQHWNYSNGCQ